MVSTLSPSEAGQLAQTIEMFEVITQSQPNDYQSLEILKEAYAKLGREAEAISTSKRIAKAYVQMGQLSSAILEYETILQRYPDDPDVQAALKQIESKANSFPVETLLAEPPSPPRVVPALPGSGHHQGNGSGNGNGAGPKPLGKTPAAQLDLGQRAMARVFVESKVITPADFELCWTVPDPVTPPGKIVEPFIQVLADKGLLSVDRSLRLLSDKSPAAYLPLENYDVDLDLARKFPADVCQRWCVLPFDRMSKSILVGTANPFNQQAAKELGAATTSRLLWYLAPPVELIKNLRKAFR